jgi:hypothetical protein
MGFQYTDGYTQGLVSLLPVMDTIKAALERVKSGAADAALFRWFGDNSLAWRTQAANRIERLRRVFNLQNIAIGFANLSDRNQGENANALPGGITGINPALVGQYHANNTLNPILLNESFRRLPSYLPVTGTGIVDTSGWNQSRLETVLHEMSHLILTTADERPPAGPYAGVEAYGAQRARSLATLYPAQAQNNAENWGIFIEACGRNRSS